MESRMTKNKKDFHPFHVEDEQIRLLERLSNACAVSGDEGEVRKIVLEEVSPHADEVRWTPWAMCWSPAAAEKKKRCG
jgi:hypothetical protein